MNSSKTSSAANPAAPIIHTGIYGGSFNPIHRGHLAMAHQILSAGMVDEIWFMVSPRNPLKQQADLMPDARRLQWVHEALADESRMQACDYEFHLPKPSYTWNTLQHLCRDFPQRRFSLIIGADNWAVFDKWAHHDDILRHHHIFIYPRNTNDIDPDTLPPHVHLLQTPLYNISSTEIRRLQQAGEPVDHLLPPTMND